MFDERPTLVIPETVVRSVAISRREADSMMVGAIVALGGYLAVTGTGVADAATLTTTVGKFLGVSAPLFALALAFLLWVMGALIVEVAGLSDVRRRWDGIAAALFYLENAAPFVGLL